MAGVRQRKMERDEGKTGLDRRRRKERGFKERRKKDDR